jgi:hypothetical protein
VKGKRASAAAFLSVPLAAQALALSTEDCEKTWYRDPALLSSSLKTCPVIMWTDVAFLIGTKARSVVKWECVFRVLFCLLVKNWYLEGGD